MENMDQILDAPALEEQRRFEYAGFWIRVAAYIIDGILLGVVNYIIGLMLTSAPYLGTLISVVLAAGYFSVMESSENQATLGKQAVGIKVGDWNGKQLTLGNALGRYLSKFLSALILCIGFMMVGWDEKKQGLHDKIAETYVFYR